MVEFWFQIEWIHLDKIKDKVGPRVLKSRLGNISCFDTVIYGPCMIDHILTIYDHIRTISARIQTIYSYICSYMNHIWSYTAQFWFQREWSQLEKTQKKWSQDYQTLSYRISRVFTQSYMVHLGSYMDRMWSHMDHICSFMDRIRLDMFYIWTTYDHNLFQIARIQLEKIREKVAFLESQKKTRAILRRGRNQKRRLHYKAKPLPFAGWPLWPLSEKSLKNNK